MKCELCQQELEGDLAVDEQQGPDITVITILELGRRNWICCDSCGKFLCHNCCTHPRSGYCDTCIDRFNLNVKDIEGIEVL